MLLLAPAAGRAQQVLLQTDVALDTLTTRTGPNRAWFGHLYAGLAGAAGPSALGVRYGLAASEWQVGGRLKRRLSGRLALQADLRYGYLRYGLRPDVARPAPLAPGPDRQTLAYHQVQGELSLRLNPGRRRGNIVGRYVDLLAYGGRALGASYTYEEASAGGGRREVTEHEPAYLARWLGGAGLRLGSGPLALTGRYRLSAALAPGAAGPLPEPPRYLLGIELSWF